MIVNRDTNTVLESNIEDSNAFTVMASSKAFKILSTNLYKNKHESILRELVSNALDSHKQAGQDKDVVVLLPTELDPNLRIVDCGVGMSQEDIRNVYTQLFASTKDKSEDFIGGFGLGSKTPFSISNGFFITSVKDGISTKYFMHLDNDIPSYSIMETASSDDSSGVTISIPCTEEDIELFNKYLFQIACMPRVHIVGYTRSIKEREIHSYLENMDMTKIDVAILHDNSMCYGENVLVCIGGVIYPNLGYSYSGLFGVSDSMLLGKAVILLNIPIAQATVTASREYLDTSIHTTLYFKETFGGLLKQRQTELLNNLLGIDKELSEYSFDELDVIANTFISKSQEKLLNRTLVSELILEAIYDKSPSLPSMTFIEEILSCSALETNGIVIYSADRGLITTTPKTIKGILDSKEIVTVAAYEYKAELCGYIASCAADRLDNLLLRNKATYLIGVPRATLHLFRDEQEQYPFKIRSSSLDKAFFHPKVRDAYPPTCRSEKKEASVWEIVVYAKENNNAYNYIVASEKGFKENIHKMVGIYYALTASDLSSLEQNTIFHLDRRNTVHFSNRQLVWLKEVGLTEDFTLHSLQTNTLKDLDKLPYAKLVLMCYTVFTRLNEYNYYTNILNAIQLENNTYRGIRLGFGYNVAKKIHTSGIDFKPFTTEDGRIKVELLTKFIYLLNSLKFIYDSKYIEESEELSNAAIKQDIINKIEEVKNEIYTSEV